MAIRINPNMFGLPYQFPSTVDPRYYQVDYWMGKSFLENIGTEAPICTFIPGVASYLSNDNRQNKINSAAALLTNNGSFTNFRGAFSDFKSQRLYDFKNDYTDYIRYVNALCRAGAIFLDLGDAKLSGTKLSAYNWKDYRWTGGPGQVSGELSKNGAGRQSEMQFESPRDRQSEMQFESPRDTDSGTLDRVVMNKYFVQFYVDADVSASDNFSNSTSESMMKGLLDTGSSTMKELAFMANSGLGSDAFGSFAESSFAALEGGISQILGGGTVNNALSRIINLGGETLTGNNIIMPDVYQNSSYTKSYSITVHLKTPYGNKFGYYMNIFVPLMHLICLAIPRQATANSYESPFLVKAYVDGVFSCNMGIIQGISVSKSAESWSVDGLPSEVDVTIDLVDLYSGIQMTPTTNPYLFYNNSSLIEYLAVNCGLSLISPNISAKLNMLGSDIINTILDMPQNVGTRVKEKTYTWLNGITRLYK